MRHFGKLELANDGKEAGPRLHSVQLRAGVRTLFCD